MNRIFKIKISSLLAGIMLFGVALIACLAKTDMFFADVLAIKVQAASNYSCGDNLTWRTENNGILRISGNGSMYNYTYDNSDPYSAVTRSTAPWCQKDIQDIQKQVKSVIIEDGVTSIGTYAFSYLPNLTTINIPESVTKIDDSAFMKSDNIESIYYSGTHEQWKQINIHKYSYYKYIPSTIYECNSDTPYYYFEHCGESIEAKLTLDGDLFIYGTGEITSAPWSEYAGIIKSVTISEGIINIYGFSDCVNLVNITMPHTITKISSNSLKNCTSIENFDIPETVTYIGSGAFYNCTNLKSIDIPDSVIEIGTSAFAYCRGLQSVSIGDGLSKIPMSMFLYCTSLTNIGINNSVTEIGSGAFAYCVSLESVVIPDSVIKFDGGFSYCSSLKEITIPVSINASGKFYNCTNIETVNLTVGNGTMYNYFDSEEASELPWIQSSKIKNINIENGVLSIGDYAFYGLQLNNIDIPESVTRINCYAFSNSNIRNIDIPSNVSFISFGAFENCTYLSAIVLPDNLEFISFDTFKNCTSLSNVVLGNKIESVGSAAFYNCVNLKEITLPDSCNTIYGEAFYNCKSLTELIIPNSVTTIKKSALAQCTSLEKLTIPFIGESKTTNTFLGYIFGASSYGYNNNFTPSSLKYLTLSNACTEIPNYALYSCENIISVVLPKSLVSVGDYAFRYCTKLHHVFYEGTSEECENINVGSYNGPLYCIRHYETTEHKYVTLNKDLCTVHIYGYCSLCEKNFATTLDVTLHEYDASGICTKCGVSDDWEYYISSETAHIISYTGTDIDITIPSTIEGFPVEIGSNIFRESVSGTIRSLIISEGITTIGSYAFYNCINLTDVTIPTTLKTVKAYAFYNCKSIKNVYISDVSAWCNIDFAGYEENPVYYSKSITLNGLKIENLVIPDGTKIISDYAFYNCSSIVSVNFPKTLETIGRYSFAKCEKLTSITIPEGVKEIDSGAFYYCSNVQSITIPDTVESIGELSFYATAYYNDRTNWIDGVLYINNHLIVADSYLLPKIYQVKEGTKSIALSAFKRCYNLEKIVIPEGIKLINVNTFYNCSSLKSVYMPNSIENILWDVFVSCHEDMIIYCYENSYVHSFAANYGYTYKFICTTHDWEEASCTTPKCCKACGLLDGNVLNHISGEATCVDQAICTVCGQRYGEANPNNHSPKEAVKENIILPECEKTGSYELVVYCNLCNKPISREIVTVDALEHSYEEYVLVPTCTETGCTTHICSLCGDEYIDNEIEVLGHNIIIDNAIASTCTATGLTEGQHCSRCNDATIEQEVTPKLKHDMVVDEAVSPTCTQSGLTAGCHCKNCDEATIEQETIASLGHVESSAVTENIKASACGQTGCYDSVVYCSACDDELSRVTIIVEALTHQYDKTVTDPTCVEDGFTTYMCSFCGDNYVSDKVEALGHNIIIDKAVEATCTSAGLTEGQHCSRCDEVTLKQETIPQTNHNHIAKYDSVKHWKECICGSEIEIQNHNFENNNTCYCGYKRMITATLSIKNNTGSKTISYGETLTLTAVVANKPDYARVVWLVNGEVKGEGETFSVSLQSGSAEVAVKLVDENEVVLLDSSGNEISDSEIVSVKAGFFQKLISFFKNLFRISRIVIQSI